MKFLVPIIVLLMFAGCGKKSEFILGNDVNTATRTMFPGNTSYAKQKTTGLADNDTTSPVQTINALLTWLNSDIFWTEYSFGVKSKSFAAIDRKLNEIVRSAGYSSYREFESYLERELINEYIKYMHDSLVQTARQRIAAIRKEADEKSK